MHIQNVNPRYFLNTRPRRPAAVVMGFVTEIVPPPLHRDQSERSGPNGVTCLSVFADGNVPVRYLRKTLGCVDEGGAPMCVLMGINII